MLQLIRLGHGTREIAQRLNLSEKAIETYRAQMAEPLAVAKSSRSTLTVVVEPHQTLEEIALSYLRSYDPKIIKQIRDLNPELKDVYRLEVGQRIRLPWRSDAEAGKGLPRKMVSSKD